MNILIGTVFLVGVAVWLWSKLPDEVAREQAKADVLQLARFIFPRIVIALIGAALFAELLPEEVVRTLFGAEAGVLAVALAVLLGPFTPGGPFVCFAVAAAGLQVGASDAAVAAFVTSWALFSVTKMLAYEAPLLGIRVTLQRLAISLPIPFVIGALVAVTA